MAAGVGTIEFVERPAGDSPHGELDGSDGPGAGPRRKERHRLDQSSHVRVVATGVERELALALGGESVEPRELGQEECRQPLQRNIQALPQPMVTRLPCTFVIWPLSVATAADSSCSAVCLTVASPRDRHRLRTLEG